VLRKDEGGRMKDEGGKKLWILWNKIALQYVKKKG
jgi:hypothetical protein